jgi:hypothetical protein
MYEELYDEDAIGATDDDDIVNGGGSGCLPISRFSFMRRF